MTTRFWYMRDIVLMAAAGAIFVEANYVSDLLKMTMVVLTGLIVILLTVETFVLNKYYTESMENLQ